MGKKARASKDHPINKYRVWPDLLQVAEIDNEGNEVRRYSISELMVGTPAMRQLASRVTSHKKFIPKPEPTEALLQELVQKLEPKPVEKPKRVREPLTGETYRLVTVYDDGWAIGLNYFMDEHALPPGCWEPYEGLAPTPTPSNGETILR